MKVGIQSPYLDTLGGGERYILTIAEFFLERGDEVDILWDKEGDLTKMAQRFGLNLAKAKFVKNIFAPEITILNRLQQSRSYDLMVVLSDGSIPISTAKKNWIHLQVPFQKSNRPKLINQLKLLGYQKVLCNSAFTKKIIDETFGITSVILYPPVDVDNFKVSKKEKTILSVGRFFSPAHVKNFAPKKQKDMIVFFKEMIDSGLTGWKLVLLGAAAPDQKDKLDELVALAKGYPITIKTDIDYKTLRDNFGSASIYWHAAGYGEDLLEHPERAEHFGITTVEAMAAGAVPVVFAGGGQLEIIKNGESGFFWTTKDELIARTKELTLDKDMMSQVSAKAQVRTKDFSKGRFYEKLQELI